MFKVTSLNKQLCEVSELRTPSISAGQSLQHPDDQLF